MATGTGNLPNPTMSFSPFAILTAEEMNDLVENIESLATGTGQGDGSIKYPAIDYANFPTKTSTINFGYGTSVVAYRLGNVVMLTMSSTSTSGIPTGGMNVTESLPSEFRPVVQTYLVAHRISGSTQYGTGVWTIRTNGTLNINVSSNASPLLNMGSVTYITNQPMA